MHTRHHNLRSAASIPREDVASKRFDLREGSVVWTAARREDFFWVRAQKHQPASIVLRARHEPPEHRPTTLIQGAVQRAAEGTQEDVDELQAGCGGGVGERHIGHDVLELNTAVARAVADVLGKAGRHRLSGDVVPLEEAIVAAFHRREGFDGRLRLAHREHHVGPESLEFRPSARLRVDEPVKVTKFLRQTLHVVERG